MAVSDEDALQRLAVDRLDQQASEPRPLGRHQPAGSHPGDHPWLPVRRRRVDRLPGVDRREQGHDKKRRSLHSLVLLSEEIGARHSTLEGPPHLPGAGTANTPCREMPKASVTIAWKASKLESLSPVREG